MARRKIIAERNLKQERAGCASVDVRIRLWEPKATRRPREPVIYSCRVQTSYGADTSDLDVPGVDEFQALAAAVVHAALFLARLAADGSLIWDTGKYHRNLDGVLSDGNAPILAGIEALEDKHRSARKCPDS